MSELTDDQLDGLFRKSAEEFETPFDSAAWQDMKTRLDANDHIVPTGGVTLMATILRWGLPTVLLLLLVGWAVYQSDKSAGPVAIPSIESKPGTTKAATNWGGRSLASSQPNNEEVANVKSMRTPEQTVTFSKPVSELGKVTPDRSTLESPANTVPPRPTKTGDVSDKVRSGKRIRKKESEYLDIAANAQKTTRRSLLKETIPTRSSSEEKGWNNTPDNELTDNLINTYGLKARPVSDKQRGTNTLIEMPSNGSIGSENELPTPVNEPIAIVLPEITELAIRPAKWPKPLTSISRSVEMQPNTEGVKIASKPASTRGLSVRFAVAPDLSSVGLKNFARPGTNIGLLLEYRLSLHWSVQSGVIQSTKIYKALTSEYIVPADLWKLPLKLPESVDGRCTMFDIPINIRYDVIVKPRLNGVLPTRWFINGGVTSYIMNKENYHYTYPPHTYNKPVDYNASTGGYGFSHINVSMGYERSISRRLSWQIEPFMKMPLKGVGFFKVNLLSTGTFFSLRYKL